MRSFFLMTAFSLFAFVVPAFAADEKKVEKKPEIEKSAPAPAKDTPLKKWMDAENALIKPLSAKDQESFFILRNKYSVHRVIKIVERDVENAIKSCGKNNPDMKEKMTARYKQWTNAIDPILDTAKKQLDKDIENQTLVDVKEAKKVLKLNDEAYEYGEKQITKQPVTTKEACEGLLASMDRTEDDMVKLLQQTLLTESVIRKRNDDMNKAKKEAKKDAPAKAKAVEGDKEKSDKKTEEKPEEKTP